ncbi:hypothetical protein TTHERM_00325671 (macronuclear) [Tetrahymena thermophila SB210]|uniref:Uncharacterized protein n=1 Tax=Tetrahymena thermophila (strain SB210) TaxID=312017 RepID=A4VCR5_TETTS|nr:hypothetical protein TTHERM_00325671 [Tetrahymena thermophila SB210]EDK31318.2 hypothetical protein TTHERM_00325671 [Tetrahymena thermophila SB210]|eukprot:XP_001471053.2 hypothetical protein TTHERM_00325671 [Tetrahymena thermophila SB210]
MERESNNDLVQENSKHDAIYRVSSDNFNLTGLNKNQPVPYTGGLEKMSSNMISNNIYPDQSYLLFKSMFDDPSNPLANLFKSSIENFQFSNNNNNLSQVPSSQQDLLSCFGNNANNVSLLVNPQYLGSSFPSVSSFPQVKTNKQSPLQGLSFEIKDVSSINSNNNHNNSSSNNNNSALLSMNQSNINNSLLNSNDNSNNSNKSIQNGLSRGISSSNSNFNCNLQGFNKPLLSNEYPISSFINNGFNPNQSILSNDMAQNKEPFTKISSSSSSSRTHSTKRGTTIIIQAQNINSPAVVNKQSSDSNQQENILNQNEIFGMQNLNNDQVKQSNMYEFLSKQIDQKVPQKESSANNKTNIEKILFNQNKVEEIKKEELEEEQNNVSASKVKKSARISKKQNLSGEEKIPNKKRKDDHTLKQSGDHNFSDETQGLNCEENAKSAVKFQIKQEEEKIEKSKIKNVQIKEEDFHEQAVSEALSSEVKPLKNKEKQQNTEGQEKKSSSRQSQHKNVYKNFGKELLRFVRCKQQTCKELTQDEYRYLLDQLTGGLNDKDTKQTLPIQKKEKLQLLWTLKTEPNTASHASQSTNSKKQKNDHHNKNDEDKTQEYYFITEKEDEILESDNTELKTKKYFRKISWEFFNEWAYQYVINSRKLDKKEIHLKCIPSFLYGIMCPKSLEVFKPIREHDKIPQNNQSKQSNVNQN